MILAYNLSLKNTVFQIASQEQKNAPQTFQLRGTENAFEKFRIIDQNKEFPVVCCFLFPDNDFCF